MAAVLAALLAAGAIVVAATKRQRLLTIVLAVSIASIGVYAVVTLLGRPQPTALALTAANHDGIEVLFADWTEGVGVYVLARRETGGAPRLYSLPWHRPFAEQLQRAMELAREREGILYMSDVFRVPSDSLRERVIFTVSSPSAGTEAP